MFGHFSVLNIDLELIILQSEIGATSFGYIILPILRYQVKGFNFMLVIVSEPSPASVLIV